MIRLFVGIELPQTIKQQLHLLSGGIQDARWTDEANYHITLAFIGNVDEPIAADIDETLETIPHKSFDLQVKGLGQFDRGGHTIIVWAGIDSNPDLAHLSDKVKTALSRKGIDIDRRKYAPHITLARIGHGAKQERIFRYLGDHGLFSAGPFPVDHFCLFESLRGNGAPVYRPIRRYRLL
jgi:2'-5' RNA ligase